MKALIIRDPWIEKILAGEKTWELRGSQTTIRGLIGLIQSGTGTVVGTCEIESVVGPLSVNQLRCNTRMHAVPARNLDQGSRYKNTYAWVIKNAKSLLKPVKYVHPQGAVIWVNLSPTVSRKVKQAAKLRSTP